MNVHLKHFKDKDEVPAWAIESAIFSAENTLHDITSWESVEKGRNRINYIKQVQQIIWVDQDETL